MSDDGGECKGCKITYHFKSNQIPQRDSDDFISSLIHEIITKPEYRFSACVRKESYKDLSYLHWMSS